MTLDIEACNGEVGSVLLRKQPDKTTKQVDNWYCSQIIARPEQEQQVSLHRSGRLQLWRSQLPELYCDDVGRAGVKHQDSDVFSRLRTDRKETTFLEEDVPEYVWNTQMSDEEIIRMQVSTECDVKYKRTTAKPEEDALKRHGYVRVTYNRRKARWKEPRYQP